MKRSRRHLLASAMTLGALTLAATPASASFHFMQIEQAIGGICGDPSMQAIQLRMRMGGQNQVAGTTLVAYDATGDKPVTLLTLPSNVTNSALGSRILVASSQFAADTGQTPDFTLSNLIPPAYFAAGRLTFQSGNVIYWSLSWGGTSYTGSNAGDTTNDADGNFGPPFAGPLPSAGGEALRFQGAAGDPSTSNAADYALTTDGAVFTNNAGVAGPMIDCSVFADDFELGNTSAWSRTVP